MRNFIGNFLIAFAAFLTFLRNVIFFALTAGIVLGIMMITIFALFALFSRVNPDPHMAIPIDLFGKWYWELIIVVIGSLTMWQGISKMFENDKKETEKLNSEWGNHNYHGNKKVY